MSSSVGGDIREITFNHPTLGNGIIYAKSAEDSTYDLGGLRGNDDDNMLDGAGNNIRQLNMARWSFETTIAWDMNNRKDLEKLVALAGDPVEADWTISHINGTIYGGKGSPVGDMKGNGNAATFSLKIAGGGGLKAI